MHLKSVKSIFLLIVLLLGNTVVCAASEKGFSELAIDADGFSPEQRVKDSNSNDGEGNQAGDSYALILSSHAFCLDVAHSGTGYNFHQIQTPNPTTYTHGIRAPPLLLAFS